MPSSLESWGALGSLTYTQATFTIEQGQEASFNTQTPNTPTPPPIMRPASTPRNVITGPGVLGGVGSLGAVSQRNNAKGLISSLANNVSGSMGGPRREFFASRLAGPQSAYDLRNGSISPGAIQKALTTKDNPRPGGSNIPIKPTFDYYTDPGYIFFGYYD